MMRSQGVKRVELQTQLVRFEVDRQVVVMDCVVASPRSRMLGDYEFEIGEPFTLVVRLPARGWCSGGQSTVEDWAGDGRRLDMKLSVGMLGARASICDGDTVVNFDLISVLGGIRTVPVEGGSQPSV